MPSALALVLVCLSGPLSNQEHTERLVGEVAVFARRSGDRWFVAAMNGSQARTVTIDLSFLGPGTYKGLIARDKADDPAAVDLETRDVVRGHKLPIAMRPGGGFVLRLSK